MIDPRVFLTIAAVMFAIGVYGILSRRNAVGVLLSLELMANAVNLNLVLFARYSAGALGQVVTQITLRAAPPVAAALKMGQAEALAAVERRLGRTVHIAADPLVATYELVLG